MTASAGAETEFVRLSLAEKPPISFLRCVVCSRSGRFIDPFPRNPWLERNSR